MAVCNYKTLLRALELWRDQKFEEIESAITDVQNLQGLIDVLRFRYRNNLDAKLTPDQVCIIVDGQMLSSVGFWATGHYEEALKEMEDEL